MDRWSRTVLMSLVVSAALASPARAQQETVTHVVRSGETLTLLAHRYLGDGERWPEIARANPGRISNPHLIPTGLEIEIPGAEPLDPAPPATDAPAPAVEGQVSSGTSGGQSPTGPVATGSGGPRRTVFFRPGPNGGRQQRVVAQEGASFLALPTEVFHSAAWLGPGAERPQGQGTIRAVADGSGSSHAQVAAVRPLDRVALDLGEGFRPAIGTELQIFRVLRHERGLGWVVQPTGAVTVVERDGAAFVGRVTRQFADIRLGDPVRAAARFPLERGQRAEAVGDGSLGATILGWSDPRPFQQFGDVAFLDRGGADGVRVGDEFVAVAESGRGSAGDGKAGRLQVVGVTEDRSSARILQQDGPVFGTGTPVRLAKRMR